MKDVIDVMRMQEKMDKASTPIAKLINYKTAVGKGVPSRFLFECAIKLEMKPLTSAMAAILFHKFFNDVDPADYDEFVSIGSFFPPFVCLHIHSSRGRLRPCLGAPVTRSI